MTTAATPASGQLQSPPRLPATALWIVALAAASRLPIWQMKPRKVPRIPDGDSLFRCAGSTPRAPWTKKCIRNAPTPSHSGVPANAQKRDHGQ